MAEHALLQSAPLMTQSSKIGDSLIGGPEMPTIATLLPPLLAARTPPKSCAIFLDPKLEPFLEP